MTLEFQRDYDTKTEEDQKKIKDLELEIAKEKRFIEEDLKKLLNQENQYNMQLHQGREESPTVPPEVTVF